MIQTLIAAQTTGAEFLVDEEDFYLTPLSSHDIKQVDKMLDEVSAKLLTEVRVARYEVDARQ